MIYLNIAEDWKAYGDHEIPKIELALLEHNDNTDITLCTSTHMVLDLLRALIAEGKVDYNDVVFTYKGNRVLIGYYGYIETWPDGLCDIDIELCTRILKGYITREEPKNE